MLLPSLRDLFLCKTESIQVNWKNFEAITHHLRPINEDWLYFFFLSFVLFFLFIQVACFATAKGFARAAPKPTQRTKINRQTNLLPNVQSNMPFCPVIFKEANVCNLFGLGFMDCWKGLHQGHQDLLILNC